MDTTQLKRIADALEEILRLVKQDMQKYEKKKELNTITCCHGLLMIMAHCRPVTCAAVKSFSTLYAGQDITAAVLI